MQVVDGSWVTESQTETILNKGRTTIPRYSDNVWVGRMGNFRKKEYDHVYDVSPVAKLVNSKRKVGKLV